MLRCRRLRVERSPGGDQPLMVEKRASERRLEEVVGDRVVRMRLRVQVLVDGQGPGVVDAHHGRSRVAPRRVAVLRAAVELVLLLVELVHQVARTAAGDADTRAVEDSVCKSERVLRLRARGRVRRDEVVDREPRVEEVAVEGDAPRSRAVAGLRERRHGQVHVELPQARVGRAVLVDLGRVRGVGVGESVHAFPAAVQVVEAVVLLVDHHDVVDLRKLVTAAGGARP